MNRNGTWQLAVMAGFMLISLRTGPARADFFCSAPMKVAAVNSGGSNIGGSITADGLEFYFVREQGGGFTMHMSQRSSPRDEWNPPVKLGPPFNTGYWDHTPSISADGLTLLFPSNRPGGFGGMDIWESTRPTRESPWGEPVNLGPNVNSSVWEMSAKISADGLTLLFHSVCPGGLGGEDIWMTTRETKEAPWGPPSNLGQPVNSPYNDGEPTLSHDGLMLLFNSNRPGGAGSDDLWVTTRQTASDPWGTPVNLGPRVNSPTVEWCASVSADGSTLYFGSDRPTLWGACSIYQTSMAPIVDLNGDGNIDDADVQAMMAAWGTNDPLYDIGPTLFGDGTVDMHDLAVLVQHATKDFLDPTLVGHWPLDEAEGTIAYDLAGANDATILGQAQWQPEGGKIDGALALDGMIFGTANSPVNPAGGPFSVLAWVRGGAPGQVILSQEGGMNWLMADPATGALMTELGPMGRTGTGLISEAVITDGDWHRIAFTWDGANRWLHVDGVLVAEDTRDNLPHCTGNLIFGAGRDMAPGTFFTGLIDDVRIYHRVVWP